MEILARQLLLPAVFAIVIAMGFANAVQGATAPPVVVGLAKCSDCTRKNMNTEAAFRGLQVAVKCRNTKGEFESTDVGQVDRSGAFSVPLAADLVDENGELKRECFAQLHSASSAPCSGQEPSKIVAAPPRHGGDEKTTFVALGGKVYRSSPECASAFLCYPFLHKHHHLHVGIHEPDHGHSMPPVTKPPVDVPEHKPPVPEVPEHKPPSMPEPEHKPPSTPDHKPPSMPEPEHKPPSTPDQKPPSTPVYTPPSTPEYTPPTPTPIYHPPEQRDAVTEP